MDRYKWQKKRKSREKACKCKCEFVTQHIALIEIPVAFVEFLLTNLNNLFATIHLDRSNWQKKSCENADCNEDANSTFDSAKN